MKEDLVLIDFFADWCMPCLMMAPVLEEVAEKMHGKLKIGKVDVQENQLLASKHGVSSIPNFVLFKDGKPVEQFVGAMPAEELEKRIKEHF